MFRGCEVAQLTANQGASALGVFAQHHLVPDAHQLQRVHLDQMQSLHIARLCGYVDRVGHGTVQAPGFFENRRFGLRCKDKMAYSLQFA